MRRVDGRRVATTCVSREGKRMTLYAHQLVLGAPPSVRGHHADHRNGDLLDNRAVNLCYTRVAHGERARSDRPNRGNTTGVRGVSYDAATERYVARIMVQGEVRARARFRQLAEAQAWVLAERRRLAEVTQ